MRASLPRLALAALFVLPTAARAVDRKAVLEEAARYAEHSWQMKANNQKASCKADYTSDYKPGPQVGVPYGWGGSMSLAEFDSRIAKGEAAGSHSRHGILSCVAGVDCSGFVSQVWRLPQRYTTSSISAVTRPISLQALEPGDALNKAGSHIVLYAGSSSDGSPIIYEASGSASRVRMVAPGWSYLTGYQPLRFKDIQETLVAAAKAEAPAAKASATKASASQPAASSAAAPEATPPAGVARVDAPAPQVPADRTSRVTLRYGTDVGFIPASEESQAIGPDFLVAGPDGLAALYDSVRHQVVLIARDGTRRTLAVDNADGLDFSPQGHLVVLDGVARRALVFRASGEPLRTLPLPGEKLLGNLITLERGILYATDRSGRRQPLAELSDGRFKPVRGKTSNANTELSWQERGPSFGLLKVAGETLAVPSSQRVAVRPFAPWVELTSTASDEQGRLSVRRTLRRPGQSLELPTPQKPAYSPLADLAIAPGGKTILFLAPEQESVSVIWMDAP